MQEERMSRSKKAVFALLPLALAFAGCSTFENLFQSIGGKTGAEEESAASDGARKIVTTALALPESYDRAYALRTGAPEKLAKNIPAKIDALRKESPGEYVSQIVRLIDESAEDDFSRVKAAHDVIALLVSYDAKNFWANTVPDQSWQTVIRSRLAVCEGYANTLKKFCDEMKISCEIVHGYARGVGVSLENESDNPVDNHAWNAVKIEGAWYLVDCTWDSGYMSGKTSKQEYVTSWLFLKPEQFIFSHLPSSQKFQLMQTPVSTREFLSLPDLRPEFFECVENTRVPFAKQNSFGGNAVLNLKVRDDCELSFEIAERPSGAIVKNSSFVRRGDREGVYLSFPKAADYSVTIFQKKQGAAVFRTCGAFLVSALEGSDMKYPELFDTKAKNVRLEEPLDGVLEKGKTYTFRIHAEGRKFAAVFIGRNSVQLENDGEGNFQGEAEIPQNAGSVSVGFSDALNGRYETYASYSVK